MAKGICCLSPAKARAPLQPQAGLVILSVQEAESKATASLPALSAAAGPYVNWEKEPLSQERILESCIILTSRIRLPLKCLGCVWSIRLGAEQGQKMIDSWEKEGSQRDVWSCVPVRLPGPVCRYGVLGRSSPSLRGLESAPTVTVFI